MRDNLLAEGQPPVTSGLTGGLPEVRRGGHHYLRGPGNGPVTTRQVRASSHYREPCVNPLTKHVKACNCYVVFGMVVCPCVDD